MNNISARTKLMCRLCGELKTASRIRCKINDSSLNIKQKLIDCCRWALFEEYTNLPEHICNSCFKLLEASWSFAENVAETQEKLLESLKSSRVEMPYLEPEINVPEDRENHNAVDIDNVKNIEILCTPIDFDTNDDFDYSQNLSDIDYADFGTIAENELEPSIKATKVEPENENENENEEDVFLQQIPTTPFNFDLLAILSDADRNSDGSINKEKITKLNLEDWSKLHYPCWLCNTVYQDSFGLKEHITTIHPGCEQRIVCSFCSQKTIFSRKTTLCDHVRKNHLPHLKYCCVKCNAFYYDLNLLKKHVQFHPMPRQHAPNSLCEICGIECDTSTKLRQHNIRFHQPLSQIRVYECYICRVSFKCKKSLVHHMPQHTSYEKIQYECKECFLKFSRPYALRRHSLIHTNGFPFACEYCAKPFRTRANLKVHVRIHTGERPYLCTLCEYRSIDGPNLRKHMKQRHSSYPVITPAPVYSAVPYLSQPRNGFGIDQNSIAKQEL